MASDPWILPNRQLDVPSRPVLTEPALHARRERAFLVIVALVVVSAVLPIVAGLARVIDLGAFGVELPTAMLLPLGVVVLPLGLVAVAIACDAYGRPRANGLVLAGVAVVALMVGAMKLVDVVDGVDLAFGPALALAAYFVVAHIANLWLFDALRRRNEGRQRWLRHLVAPLLAHAGGWTAFAFAFYGYATVTGVPEDAAVGAVGAIAAGASVFALAFTVVAFVPALLVGAGLGTFLRVGRFVEAVRAPKPVVVEGPLVARPQAPVVPVVPVPVPRPTRAERRSANASLQPFNSAEMRFFTEGEQLAEAPASTSQPAGRSVNG